MRKPHSILPYSSSFNQKMLFNRRHTRSSLANLNSRLLLSLFRPFYFYISGGMGLFSFFSLILSLFFFFPPLSLALSSQYTFEPKWVNTSLWHLLLGNFYIGSMNANRLSPTVIVDRSSPFHFPTDTTTLPTTTTKPAKPMRVNLLRKSASAPRRLEQLRSDGERQPQDGENIKDGADSSEEGAVNVRTRIDAFENRTNCWELDKFCVFVTYRICRLKLILF